jgi:hypothetical protein
MWMVTDDGQRVAPPEQDVEEEGQDGGQDRDEGQDGDGAQGGDVENNLRRFENLCSVGKPDY